MSISTHKNARLKILVIGSLPPPLGGTAISLKYLIAELTGRRDIATYIIDTTKTHNKNLSGLLNLTAILFKVLFIVFKVNIISAHLANKPIPYFGLYLLFLSRLTNKPLIVRKFGGNTFNIGRLKNKIAYFVLRHATVCLFQTKQLIGVGDDLGMHNTLHYPTSRPRPADLNVKPHGHDTCRRFIFVGHVKKEKGILELIDAAERLPSDTIVHVYGPFTTDLSIEIFKGKNRISYCGIIAPDRVIATLSEYDALVLPTYHAGEGYPGVIFEAYFAGLPVICTRWLALPEIVDENTGILIPHHDSNALFHAMKSMIDDKKYYNTLCEGALKRSVEFDSRVWSDYFVDICFNLYKNKNYYKSDK